MLVEKGHHTHGDIGAGIHPGLPALSRRLLCCPLFPDTVFLSQNSQGFLIKLLSGNIFGSWPTSAILHGKKWLKYQGTQHSASEVAGDCQNTVRQEGKMKNASGGCGCSGLQVGAMVVIISSLHLVVCLSATLPCPACWWEQLSFCSPATNNSETTKITDLAVMEGPSNALAAPQHLSAPIRSATRASWRLCCSQPRSPLGHATLQFKSRLSMGL